MSTSSRGAWPFYYKLGLDRRNDPNGRDAHGIQSFKEELTYGGFGDGIDLTLAYWGDAADKAVRAAQAAFGIPVDGVLGPNTARHLLRHRIAGAETAAHLPPHLLARIATVESADDVVAQGEADPNDEGMFQFNGPSHPSLTQIDRWTPRIIVPYAAAALAGNIRNCNWSVKAGTASWNVGIYGANGWRIAGFPATGGPNDIFKRATDYVAMVDGAPL